MAPDLLRGWLNHSSFAHGAGFFAIAGPLIFARAGVAVDFAVDNGRWSARRC